VAIIERRKYPLYSPSANVRRRLYRRSRSNRAFASLTTMLFLLRVVRRASSKQPEVAALDRLAPGQTIIITTTAPPTRRQRRAARRRGGESTA
jgi:hypothetical protein